MQTIQVTVGPDGRVAIPGTHAGQTVTLEIADVVESPEQMNATGPISDDEWAEIEVRVKERARYIREHLPEPWLSSPHGDLLYGEDGLPK